jgi:hypothetical protein
MVSNAADYPATPPSRLSGRAANGPRQAGSLLAACLAVCVAQIGLVLPAAINGVMQQTLHTTGSQLTWISDAFLVPAAILELTFGVLGDLCGSLATAGLTVPEQHLVGAVAAQGGPLAVLSAPLGPVSAKAAPLAAQSLAQGYNAGLVVTAAACLLAAVLAAVFLRGRPRDEQADADRAAAETLAAH